MVHIGSGPRIGPGQIDVIGDQHDVPLPESRVKPPCGIGDNQALDPDFLHDPYGKSHLKRRISLI